MPVFDGLSPAMTPLELRGADQGSLDLPAVWGRRNFLRRPLLRRYWASIHPHTRSRSRAMCVLFAR